MKTDEIKGISGSHYTTQFRELDPRIARWWSIDPKASADKSPYMSMEGNPIWFNDPLGDTIVVNKTGDITRNDETDNLVFRKDEEDGLKQIGELGKEIDIESILDNKLDESKEEAKELGVFGWANKVSRNGKWDLKITRRQSLD